jgi:hypothetical protein
MLFVFLTLLIPAVAHAYVIRSCKANYTNTNVKSVQLEPADFGPADEINIQLKFNNNNKSFADGFILYTIVHEDLIYEPQVNNLCTNVECPIIIGKQSLDFNAVIPPYIDDIDLKVELVDRNLTSFACFRLELEVTLWQRFKNWLYPPIEPINWRQHRLRGAY